MKSAGIPNLSRSKWMVLGTLLVVVSVLLIIACVCVLRFFDYRQQVSDMQPRLARLEGMLLAQENIREAEILADAEIEGLVYDADDTNSIGVNMQQAIRAKFTSAGMTVNGSNIQNVRPFENFTQVGVSISAEGTLAQFEEVLDQVIDARPIILIERLEVQPERRRSNETHQTIEVRIQLYSMKLNNG